MEQEYEQSLMTHDWSTNPPSPRKLTAIGACNQPLVRFVEFTAPKECTFFTSHFTVGVDFVNVPHAYCTMYRNVPGLFSQTFWTVSCCIFSCTVHKLVILPVISLSRFIAISLKMESQLNCRARKIFFLLYEVLLDWDACFTAGISVLHLVGVYTLTSCGQTLIYV